MTESAAARKKTEFNDRRARSPLYVELRLMNRECGRENMALKIEPLRFCTTKRITVTTQVPSVS